MRILLSILLLLFLTHLTKAQTTAIPDPNFEAALIFLGFDSGPIDGSVSTANINLVTALNLDFRNINDLTGIQDFTSLNQLYLTGNFLTTLDISQNNLITGLWCGENQLTNIILNDSIKAFFCHDNQLTNIDVSHCSSLEYLKVSRNFLTSLNLNQNSTLLNLNCDNNSLTSLNVSQNTALYQINCDSNLLTCLNVKNGNNNHILSSFNSIGNPNLTCIEVDDIAWSTASVNWYKDPIASFSTNCPSQCIVGVEEYNFFNLSLYPNPTTKTINIDLGEIITNITATLTNNLGQIIYTQKYESTDFVSLDIDAPKGIYFLQLQTKNGEIITKKIVKE